MRLSGTLQYTESIFDVLKIEQPLTQRSLGGPFPRRRLLTPDEIFCFATCIYRNIVDGGFATEHRSNLAVVS